MPLKKVSSNSGAAQCAEPHFHQFRHFGPNRHRRVAIEVHRLGPSQKILAAIPCKGPRVRGRLTDLSEALREERVVESLVLLLLPVE
jgi:hypothetical protein